MKNRVLMPIFQKDKKNLYGFFKDHKDIYQKTPITAKMLSEHLSYIENDIINIIKAINEDESYKQVLLGSNKGYYLINDTNISLAKLILSQRIERAEKELEYLLTVLKKVELIESK